ncbi:helix-hairpin-helix domain-containing protein [Staphylococcus ureilyticus]|uniref:helix-hairpin-helix domain-containing protein n=1 Tax=Staphylococcus ureilyticus TaxID=94138 RepID=UPI0030BCC27B
MSVKLMLTASEKNELRRNKIKLNDISTFQPIYLSDLLDIPLDRAEKIIATAQFQQIPSIGPAFAEDLVNLGYLNLEELKGKSGAELTDSFEFHCGHRVDPCVEDQFRLVVHYAESRCSDKQWWDFTSERKKYRNKYGYPSTRP